MPWIYLHPTVHLCGNGLVRARRSQDRSAGQGATVLRQATVSPRCCQRSCTPPQARGCCFEVWFLLLDSGFHCRYTIVISSLQTSSAQASTLQAQQTHVMGQPLPLGTLRWSVTCSSRLSIYTRQVRAFLCDFGEACLAHEAAIENPKVVGTLEWMVNLRAH